MPTIKPPPADLHFDAEEKDVIRAIDADEYVPVPNMEAKISELQQVMSTAARKTKHVNIRISPPDIEAIRARAVAAGLPYQSLISSVLHQYAMGKIEIQL